MLENAHEELWGGKFVSRGPTQGVTRRMPDERRMEPGRRIKLHQTITLMTSDGVTFSVVLKDL